MPPETAEIAALSQQYGFAGPALEKTARLLELLNAINRHAGLRACLALRGGTALHWFCLDEAQRLSVDIDLVYTGPAGAPLHEMRAALRGVLQREGIAVHHAVPYPEPNPELWQVAYECQAPETQGLADRLVIDLDVRPAPPIHDQERRTSHALGRFQARDIRTVHAYEVAVGKLTALMHRRKARDLYDVSLLSRAQQWDFAQLQRTFLEANARQGRDVRERTALGLRINPEALRTQLQPLLKCGTCPDAFSAWTEFSAQLRQRASSFLDRLRALTSEQHAWLDAQLATATEGKSGQTPFRPPLIGF